MKKLSDLVKQDAQRSESANEYFTNSLGYLEENKPQEAKVAARKCFAISDSIEQRLAATLLIQLADSKSHQEIMTLLNDIYSYSKTIGGAVNDN